MKFRESSILVLTSVILAGSYTLLIQVDAFVAPVITTQSLQQITQQQQQQQQQQQRNRRTIDVVSSSIRFNSNNNKALTTRQWLSLDDDDDEDDDDEYDDDAPLSDGVDSVSWLPSVTESKSTTSLENTKLTQKDSEIIPLFPLGGIVYTPNSEHVLNIFEPRYREMYTDILMNGTKRFAVSMSHPTKTGTFAQMAVLFELQDLKEVSEQTADQIKYICNHKVTGRVKLHRILNPEVWETRTTYLRAEGTIIDDSGKNNNQNNNNINDKENPIEEKKLRNTFNDLVELQHILEEDVRFTRASVISLGVKPGSGENGLWQTIKLWSSFVDQRLMARQNELQRDFQDKLQNYLKKEKGLKGNELPSTIGFNDLSSELQAEVIDLQKRMAVELQPLVLESTLTMQKILECNTHTERVQLVRHFIESEIKRLNTKKTIKGMFSGNSTDKSTTISSDTNKQSQSLSTPSFPPEEQLSPDEDKSTSSRKSSNNNDNSSSSFFSDEDAFQ